MNGWDFTIFWQAGQAILNGQNPYQVEAFYYPLPYAYGMIVIAVLPLAVALALWQVCNLGMLVLAFRKRFWQWLFYLPVLHGLSSGQNTLLWWFMASGLGRHWRGALLGALMTLKPQTAFLLLSWHLVDWLLHDRRTFLRWAALTALLWGSFLLVRPGWMNEWLGAQSNSAWIETAGSSPGLFSLLRLAPEIWPFLAVVAAVVYIWGQFQSVAVARATALMASPLGLFYETMALMGMAPAWLLVPLSLLATGLSFATVTFVPFLSLPLAVIGWSYYRRRAASLHAEERTAPAAAP
ncbi:MAG: hypothetical protein K8J31_13660 [Anaerolineae bacterium]|nr:hypothetical protein [Anaerolineae bacterium]